MYIFKINEFLPEYKNINNDNFLSILKKSNSDSLVDHKLEKDFLLTIILIKFGQKYPNLVFKGGTCLNKIYFPYFRLSEDLDFVLDKEIGRAQRQTMLRQYEKDFIKDLQILGITLRPERTKFDEHKLAMFVFEYTSALDESIQTIKIDLSLKNKLCLPSVVGIIKSMYKDPVFEESVFGIHQINCIDIKESVAEKLRAGLTRNEPAIRDFFDIWYIRKYSDFDFDDTEFRKLVNIKLQEVNYEYSIDGNFQILSEKITTDLKPVLKLGFDFDLKEIYDFILTFKKPNT